MDDDEQKDGCAQFSDGTLCLRTKVPPFAYRVTMHLRNMGLQPILEFDACGTHFATVRAKCQRQLWEQVIDRAYREILGF